MRDQTEQQPPPRHGIVRLAWTPANEPDATVICPGHVCEPDPERMISPLEAMRRSTRFEFQPADDTDDDTAHNPGAGTGYHLPVPLANAMAPGTAGALHVWCYSDQDDGDPFWSCLLPRVLVRDRTTDWDRHQVVVQLRLRGAEPHLLPYLARLPEDERPDLRQWTPGTNMLLWTVDAVPEATCPVEPAPGDHDPVTAMEHPLF